MIDALALLDGDNRPTITDEQIATWKETPEGRAKLDAHATAIADFFRLDAQVNQLVYYRPISDKARRIHLSTAREIGAMGGNKASKTGTMLADSAIQMTGIVPLSLRDVYPKKKLRGRPIRVRLVVTSLENAWDQNLKHKLQYSRWNGKLNADQLPGDPALGHWGFIPQRWLINGDWDQSWSEKHRTLTLWNPDAREPWSTLVVMSHAQDEEDFNQGAFDLIVEDEIPPEHIHRANRIRAMELSGQVITGGTPPDDRSTAVTAAWFFDQILTPGFEGSNPEETFAVQLWTADNTTLDEKDVAFVAKGLTPEQTRARLYGESIHLSGLIFPGFTEHPKTWCFRCALAIIPVAGVCDSCGGTDLVKYRHVWDDAEFAWPGPSDWPTLFYMDPHQARPTACGWFKVSPRDEWWQVAEQDIAGNATTVRDTVYAFEREHGLTPLWRKGDPKITAQGNQFATEYEGERFTIREMFENVGFYFDNANSNFTVGRDRILEAFKPNPSTRQPALRVHRSCTRTIYQLTHFVWETGARRENVNVKEKPGKKDSDFPALWRYLANDEPTWRGLQYFRAPVAPVSAPSGVGRNERTGW